MSGKLKKILDNPLKIVSHIIATKPFRFLSDETYIRIKYYCNFHKKLNLDNPQTYNEKLQWLKLHDRKPIYTTMVDKYEAKKYVADIIGEEYIIPTIGVWDKFDDIDFEKLPNQFVLKCTHDSGGLVICRDKSQFDMREAKSKIEKCLKKISSILDVNGLTKTLNLALLQRNILKTVRLRSCEITKYLLSMVW